MKLIDRDEDQRWSDLGERFILLTRGRMAYLGLLGHPKTRRFGALTVYIAIESPFRIRVEQGDWQTTHLFAIAPETRHQISTSDRLIAALLIEVETVSIADLPVWLQPGRSSEEYEAQAQQLRETFLALRGNDIDVIDVKSHFDEYFFGQALQPRAVDHRIMNVIDLIGEDPTTLISAEDCARRACLSVSRFLHLFKENTGTTLRRFRAWKRARNFLGLLTASSNLTDIAFDIGYPDSSHFSHTVRWYWGLTPQNMVAGSKGLHVFDHRR